MRIVILSQETEKPPLCLMVEPGGGIAWRRLHSGDAAGEGETVLVVPGLEAAARWLHLPTRNASQARAAARLQWEDQNALPGEALHLALGPLEEDGHRLVVAVAQARMQEWLDMARQHGVTPDLVLPDYLALPESGDGEAMAARMPDGHAILRGVRLAFACESELLPALLGDRPVKSLDSVAAARLMSESARAPAINLLQGDFAVRQAGWRDGRRLRRVAMLAALLLASPVLLSLGAGVRLDLAAQGLRADSLAAAAAVAPGDDPLAALAQEARRTELAAGGGPMGLVAGLAAALEAEADLQLEGLELAADGAIMAGLRHASPEELDALTALLRRRGIMVTVARSRPEAGRIISDLRLGGAS